MQQVEDSEGPVPKGRPRRDTPAAQQARAATRRDFQVWSASSLYAKEVNGTTLFDRVFEAKQHNKDI
eukprot:10864713-Lingulodinium_polyedra.AAC.1